MNKIFYLLYTAFFVVGTALLGFSFSEYRKQSEFVNLSLKSEGVITYMPKNDNCNSKACRNYLPVVVFYTNKGDRIQFRSKQGYERGAYQIGEVVEVIYDPTNPYLAQINDFSSKWTKSISFLVPGLPFSIIGGALLFSVWKFYKNKRWLLKHGHRIASNVKSVEINLGTTINGRHPYFIVSQWQDPKTKKVFEFRSEDVWANPQEYIYNNKIDVLVHPKNINVYYVDIRFLS